MCSNPISPYDNAYPPYLWPQVAAVLEAQGLPYLPSMAPIFVPNDPFAAFHYSDGRHMAPDTDEAYSVEMDDEQIAELKAVLPEICKAAYGATPCELWSQENECIRED